MWKKIPPSFEIMQTTTTQGRQDTHKKQQQQQQETPEQKTDDGLVDDLSPRQPSAFYIHVRVFRYSMKIIRIQQANQILLSGTWLEYSRFC
jgi:hypothetical protein